MSILLLKLYNFLRKNESSQQRKLFLLNPQSKVHPSFKTGFDNVFDISEDAVIDISENVQINRNNFITIKKGAKLKIGRDTYITRATISCLDEVSIGENCILGEGLKIFDHNHKYTTRPFSVSKTEFNTKAITIGNNVWTGANVIILKGVNIGDNVILGAGCVIYKDIPANSVIINQQQLEVKPLIQNT